MITYKELKEKCDCWKGYKRKPGTKPCADGSCVKEEASKPIGADKHHVLAFGRMNPITSGHEAVVNKVHSVAKEHGASHNVVVSHSQDAKKNPLSGEQKVAHAKNAFPETNVSSASKEAPTILHHAAAAHKAGATHLHVVAGSDRAEEMHNLLHKYNGKDSAHGHYNFKKITVHSSGERDPDSEGTTGISASKMREHAASGNKEAFHAGAPSKMKPEHKDAMYHDVRKGMNIKEETTPYWKKPSFNKRMSQMAKQERKERERKEAEKKQVKEETVDQQDDRKQQLKRFNDQVAAMSKANGPQKETETELDDIEKELMGLETHTTKAGGLMHEPTETDMHPRHAKIKHMTEEDSYLKNLIGKLRKGMKLDKNQAELVKGHIGRSKKYTKHKNEINIDESALNPKDPHGDYKAKSKALQDLSMNKDVDQAHVTQRKLDLDKEYAKHKTVKESNKHYDEAEEHLSKANDADAKGDTKSFHAHMANHHDSMSMWHDSKGRSASADKHAEKAEFHHEKSLNEHIAKVDGGYEVQSHTGKNLGKSPTLAGAKKRLQQVEYFKHVNEGAIQPNGTDKIDTQTSAPTASTAKDTTVGKKIKGFKFFQGQNEPNTVREEKKTVDIDKVNAAGEEPHHEKFEPVKKKTVKEQAPVAPTIDRKYIKGTPEHKAHKEKSKPINGHPTNVKEEAEQIDELSIGALKNYIKGAKANKRFENDTKSTAERKGDHMMASDSAHKVAQRTQGIKTAKAKLNKEETEVLDEKSQQARRNKTYKNLMAASKGARVNRDLGMTPADTGHKTNQQMNKAIGRAVSRGEVHEAATGNPGSGYHGTCPSADDRYSDMHAHVKNLTDADDKMVKHYLDSGYGAKLDGREEDHDHIKKDFEKFMKYYRPKEYKQVEERYEDNRTGFGRRPREDDEYHVPDPEIKKSKIKKEETMKSYKEFLQSIQEVKMADLPSRKIQGKSYGASYEDPEGAFETKDDMKKPEKKAAGRKAGQSVGSYKRRQPKAE